MATANLLKSSGANKLVGSGKLCVIGIRDPIGASTMLRPLLKSEKVPLIPVTSKPCEYLLSVAAPHCSWSMTT